MSEQRVLLSVRAIDADPADLVPGSILVPCAGCGAGLMVSPGGMAAVARERLRLLCVECIPAGSQSMGAPPEVVEHLRAVGISRRAQRRAEQNVMREVQRRGRANTKGSS
jgi:hypothetical protein